MNRPRIPYIRPLIPRPEAWTGFLKESYETGYYTNFGPVVREFESRLKHKYARNRVAVSCPSATAGLVAALQAWGVKGKVLIPSHTFVATAQAVLMAGCEPVFGEISAETWELDPIEAQRVIETQDISAILYVRVYGFGHDLSAMQNLARAHRIPLIVDAAAALGTSASVSGHVGQQGDIEVFSLHATKVFAIGEGGMSFLPTERDGALRRASNFGIQYPYEVVGPGLNSKLSDFQAAVGLAVLEHIDDYVGHRQGIVQRYHDVLSRQPWVQTAPNPELSPWQSYPLRLRADVDPARVVARAMEQGLELKRGYHLPLHRTRYLSRFAMSPLPVTDAVSGSMICLPVYSNMPAETCEQVLEIVARAAS